MRRLLALAMLSSLALTPSALAQSTDPCANADLTTTETGLNYRGHCVAFDRTGPPVQCLYISETQDAWGEKSALGILLVLGPDGEAVIEPHPFLLDHGVNLDGECSITLDKQ